MVTCALGRIASRPPAAARASAWSARWKLRRCEDEARLRVAEPGPAPTPYDTFFTTPWKTLPGVVWIIHSCRPRRATKMSKLGPGVNCRVPLQLESSTYVPVPPGGD